MCLLTKQIMPIKARKPIVVYKVLRKQKCGGILGFIHCLSDNRFITPWMYEKTELNKHLIAEGKKVAVRSGIKDYYAVGPGYIHCYTKIEYARWTRKYFANIIVECVIEPGTRYYKSWDGKEIAADAVFIKEKIL